MLAKAVPLYVQLQEHVLQNIRSGEWRAGERVPSEHELVRMFKVSRMTANRALRELMRAGVLARIAGVGTFVGDLKAAAHPLQIRNIAQEIRDRHQSASRHERGDAKRIRRKSRSLTPSINRTGSG